MNIYSEKSVVKTYNKLHKLPLGSITAKGWLKDQLLRSKEGTGGHLDELEPDMIATPFINYSAYKSRPGANDDATFAAGWSSEISGTYWTGLVQPIRRLTVIWAVIPPTLTGLPTTMPGALPGATVRCFLITKPPVVRRFWRQCIRAFFGSAKPGKTTRPTM